MMRKRSPYGHQRNNNNRGGGNGQMRRHHRRGPGGNNTQYEQGDDEFVSPRLRRHAQVQREKYVNMAIDARRSGDRVQAEYWLQHADHYQRILNLAQEQFSARDNSAGEGGEDAGDDMHGGDEQAAASGAPYPQHRDNNQYAGEAAPSGEDEAYEPSYGNPAPAAQQPRRQQRHQHHNQRQQRHSQPQAEMGGGLEDVLPMPKPERNNDRFDQDEE